MCSLEVYEATSDNWRAQRNICLSQVANTAVPHWFTLLPTVSPTRGLQPVRRGDEFLIQQGKVLLRTLGVPAQYSVSGKFSGAALSVQETRHLEWGIWCKKRMWQCHVNSVKITKRTSQYLRRKAAIKMALLFIFFIISGISALTRTECGSFESRFIQELHQCIHTGSSTEESSMHAQHCETTVCRPEHRCQEHSTNCTTWRYYCNTSWEKQGSQLGIRQPGISLVSNDASKNTVTRKQLLATEQWHRAPWRANHSSPLPPPQQCTTHTEVPKWFLEKQSSSADFQQSFSSLRHLTQNTES